MKALLILILFIICAIIVLRIYIKKSGMREDNAAFEEAPILEYYDQQDQKNAAETNENRED